MRVGTRLARSLAEKVIDAPQFMRNKLHSAFDAWPAARRLHPLWRDLPVYCINMRTATRRRAIIGRQFARMGLTTVEYIDGPDLSQACVAELETLGLPDDTEEDDALFGAKSMNLVDPMRFRMGSIWSC